MTHEQYSCTHPFRKNGTESEKKEKRSIVRSYYLAKHIAVRTPVADLAGHLPADLWRDAILGGASHLDAFSGYPFRT